MTWDSVDLPEPFGPMMACTSPGFTVSDSPWRISRSSTRTCRSLTSSNDINLLPLMPHPHRRQRRTGSRAEVLSNRTFEADRDQLLRFHRKFHRQLLQHVLYKAVDHEADSFFLAEAALHAVEQHVLGDLRRGCFMLERRRRILGFHIGHGVGAALDADQERVAGGVVARTRRLAVGADEAAIGVLRHAGSGTLGDD